MVFIWSSYFYIFVPLYKNTIMKQKLQKIILLSILIGFTLSSCTTNTPKKSKLSNGSWYAEFTTADSIKIPFVFEVENADNDSLATVVLINGEERVPLKGIIYNGDTITIPIEAYDTQLTGVISNDTIKGQLKKLFDVNDKGLDFVAYKGIHPRFDVVGTTAVSPAGRWNIQFINKTDTVNNIGIFANTNGVVTGSVLTTSGDLRFLEGVVDKDGFRLSAFAGLTPYLINGTFLDNDHFTGKYVNARGVQEIIGTRNDNATLENTTNLTQLKDNHKTLGFKLKDLDGKTVSLSDSKYKDKVVVISILGSWCPNCLDEMTYLVPWYNENKSRGVEIIGIAFERKDDSEYIHKVLNNLVKKYNTTYPILIGGKIGDEKNALPELTQLKGYPTTIFIDKKGEVREIHTGFNGPATGLFYDEFKKDFNALVDSLLAE